MRCLKLNSWLKNQVVAKIGSQYFRIEEYFIYFLPTKSSFLKKSFLGSSMAYLSSVCVVKFSSHFMKKILFLGCWLHLIDSYLGSQISETIYWNLTSIIHPIHRNEWLVTGAVYVIGLIPILQGVSKKRIFGRCVIF